ncbi:MAG: glycosyl hydrolase [Acidobacteriota bacterium]|nr:glycosyl hydrolase [Acidobacteriota bacterium]
MTRVKYLAVALFALLFGTLGTTAQTQAPVSPVATQTASIQEVDPSLLSGLRWRSIGPARGGRSQAAAGSSKRPMEYYFGAVGGGVWKTTDGGVNWRPVSDRYFKTSSVGAIAVSESNPDVVYVGMGETQLRGNIIQGDGVYKTTDAGRTWTHVGLEKTRAIGRIRVHPTNPDIVYVAALGDPYASTPDRGVFKSIDGGKTWERVLFRDDKTGAVDLSMDAKSPDVLYAGMWEVFRTPHSLSSGGPGSGLFKSTDGGGTWTELTKNPGLPKPVWGKIGVSVSPADPSRVYAIIEAQDGGLYLSDDAGATWKLANADRNIRQRAFYYTRVTADPQAKDTVYILNVSFYRSTDAGKTISNIRVPHGDNHDLWIAPDDPKRMIQSNDGGANVSLNAGQTWTDQDFPTAQFYNVVTTTHVPYHVCGAQQDNSTACVPSTGGALYDVGGGESGYIAPDPEDTDVFYAGSYGGLLTRINRRTGERRNINVWPDNPMGHSASDMTERFQWTFPIVIAPTNPNVLYVTSQHVWRSTNEGQSWERISPDLTRHDPSTIGPSGGPITLDQTGVETYATVFTLAPSPVDGNVIWAGSDDGVVHVTRDGGKNWQKVTPDGLPDFTRISLIDASPHAAGTAYLAGNRYQRGDPAPYVYKTSDYGKSWSKITAGIPGDDFPRTIREDKVRKGLLFLGTEQGIFVSFNDGGQWQSLRGDLPVTPVHGIAVKDNDLVIGTHGRSFYILDNISVLRQANAAMTNEPLVLFDPADAVRSVSRSVMIDYYLKAPADKVTIDILDPAGKVIRTYSGPQPPQAAAPDRPAEMEEGEAAPRQAPAARVTATAGMNRFMWDMRYPNAVDFPEMIMWAAGTRGPAAPPGRYQVRVSAAGVTKTQDVQINRNAAVPNVTDADLQAQFALAMQINERVSEANRAVIRIREIKTQINERIGKASDADLKTAGQALIDKLTDVEGEIYQHRLRSGQDPLNYPIRLNNKLAALQGTVEGGDYRPTAQALAVFKELSGRLDKELARLEAVVKTDVAEFNRRLSAAGLEPVKGTI